MFELTKAARLAEAAINVPSTVMKAHEFGTGIGGGQSLAQLWRGCISSTVKPTKTTNRLVLVVGQAVEVEAHRV